MVTGVKLFLEAQAKRFEAVLPSEARDLLPHYLLAGAVRRVSDSPPLRLFTWKRVVLPLGLVLVAILGAVEFFVGLQ
jgi:hypothetical protein